MSRVIKEEILTRLKEGISLVSFLKRNEINVAEKSFLNSSTNPVVAIPVWDIEHDGWRSFRIDSIISFEDKDK